MLLRRYISSILSRVDPSHNNISKTGVKMIRLFILLFLGSITGSNFAQTKYYVATGKDSITYLASNIGLMTLIRNSNQELVYHSLVDDSNKVYTRALDNDSLLLLGTDQYADLYSLSDRYSPDYIGTLNIPNIVSFRTFGNHFAVLTNTYDHYIVGMKQDTFKILTSINALHSTYTGRTEFYPEVVYPYFFSIDSAGSGYTSKLLLFKFVELSKNFEFIDTINLVTPDWELVQIYGAKDRLYMRERYGTPMYYNVHAKKYSVYDDTLYFLSQNNYNSNFGFTDEIECTDTLIRFNGNYTYLNGQALTEPNGYLFSYANLSGIRIYNTVQWGVPSYTKMYYSTEISGNIINSAQYIYEQSSVDEGRNIKDFTLYDNYPNPFNSTTVINFSLPERAEVSINVYNTLGEFVCKVVDNSFDAGYQSVNFNASALPSGIYIYRIEAKGNDKEFISSKKMIFLK